MSFYQPTDFAVIGGEMLKAHYDQMLWDARFLLERDSRAVVQQIGLAGAAPLAIGGALTNITPIANLPQNIYEPVNWLIIGSVEVQLNTGVSCSSNWEITTTNTTPLGLANGSGQYTAANSERYRGQFVTCAKMVTVAAMQIGTFRIQALINAGAGIVAWRASMLAIRIG